MSVGKVLAAFYERAAKQGGYKRHDFWTVEKIDKLRALVADPAAYSGTQIGHILGCSRCAVFGKIHRLGLSMQVVRDFSPAKRPRPAKSPSKDHGVRARAPALIDGSESTCDPAPEARAVKINAAKIPPVYKTPLLRLKARDCRFPFGDPKLGSFGFCGASTRAGSSFCEVHHALCYTPRKAAA